MVKLITDEIIYKAAIKWCGTKDRETFQEDIIYFEHNWEALPGLREFVLNEMIARIHADAKALAEKDAEIERLEKRSIEALDLIFDKDDVLATRYAEIMLK